MKKFLAALFLVMALVVNVKAQEKIEVTASDYQNTKVEMADQLREDGKIYVLVAIVSTILAGLIVYAVRIDRKVGKLEKELHD